MIKINSAGGFTTDELSLLNEAVDKSNQVLQSKAFADQVTAFKGSNGIGFANTTDANIAILTKLLIGNWGVSVSIQTYPWWRLGKKREIACENPDGSIVFNRRFFGPEGLGGRCGTLTHEVCHVAGYSHASASQWDSVPYAIGSIVEGIVNGGVL